MTTKMIPVENCKNRRLYKIQSRNLDFGVFNDATSGFTGIREKYDYFYAFEEYHWGTGEPFGTACPYEELPDELPPEIEQALYIATPPGTEDNDNKALYGWLCKMEMKYFPDLAKEREEIEKANLG